MKRFVFILLGIICILFSCKKESHNQFSHWYVGSDSFASNNVSVERYSDGMRDVKYTNIKCNNSSNFFDFDFDNINYLPESGIYNLIDSSVYNPSITGIVYASFGYNGKYYTMLPSAVSQLYVTQVNGKSVFRMDSTMFYNINDTNDSVIIRGIFSQP